MPFPNVVGIALSRDIKNTFRIWRNNRGSTLAAFLALTIGIGSTAAIFSILNSLLFRPLPFEDADRIFRVATNDGLLSLPNALDLKQRLGSVATVAVFDLTLNNLNDDSKPLALHVLEADAALPKALGLKLLEGRAFDAEANQPGRECEVLLSAAIWRQHFGGLPIVGKMIRLNNESCRVDGVLPEQLDLPLAADLWRPLPFDLNARQNGRGFRRLQALAHLETRVSIQEFNAELSTIARQLEREYPNEDGGLRFHATLFREWLSQGISTSVGILFAAVLCVLLLACANVANLLLSRSTARMREMTVRIAVGASRRALVQQLLTESMMLAFASSLSGLLLAEGAVLLLKRLPNIRLPRPESIVLDWRVVVFTILLAGATGLLFGLVPAFRVSISSLTGTLTQAGGRISESRGQQFVRKLLVGGEAGVATTLLVGSLLLIHSFGIVSQQNLGFDIDHLLTAYLSLPNERYSKDTKDSAYFAQQVVARLKDTSGVKDATFAFSLPLHNLGGSGPVQIEGGPIPSSGENEVFVIRTGVSPSYRSTLRIPLVAGRDLNQYDDLEDATAVLVNETFARDFFPSSNAVGRRIRYSPSQNPTAKWQEIVGVIADTKQNGLEDRVRPEIFVPISRTTSMYPAVIVRTANDPTTYLWQIQHSVHEVDPEVPTFLPRTMKQVESQEIGPRAFNTALLAGFAAIALFLACGGVFAVIAYSVSQRTSEIGVRMACGATSSEIIRMIVRQGLIPALAGSIAGVFAALFLSRYLAALLFGVARTDLSSYLGAALLLSAFSALAAWLPARRAARIDPWKALRYE